MNKFRRVAVSQESLESLQSVLPRGWQVGKYWSTSHDWFSPHSPEIVSATNGHHALFIPDSEKLQSSPVSPQTPRSQNPLHETWNSQAHGPLIRSMIGTLDGMNLAEPRVLNLANWYRGEKELGQAHPGTPVLGYSHDTLGRHILMRRPSEFLRHTLLTLSNPNYGRDLKNTHGGANLTGEADLDDLSDNSFGLLKHIAFGQGPEFHESGGNHYLFRSFQPPGTHLIGADSVHDTLRHEAGHTEFFKNFNRDLEHPSPDWPQDSPHSIHDFIDEIGKFHEDVKQRGDLWKRLTRFSPAHQRHQDLWKSNPNYNHTTQQMHDNFRESPGWYTHQNAPGYFATANGTGGTSPLFDGILTAANSEKGSQNLQELWATHFADWMNPCSKKDEFGERLARRFNWPDPHNKLESREYETFS